MHFFKVNHMYKLRKAIISDAPVIVSFQVKMAWETENFKLDPDSVIKGVEAVLNDPNKGMYYVAEYEGNVIACMLITTEWSDWRNGTVLWIQSLYVENEYRKRGIFKMMFNHIKNMVLENENLKGIRLYVDKSNTNAVNVYNKLGMNSNHYKLFEWMK